jgi:hypothetical protein
VRNRFFVSTDGALKDVDGREHTVRERFKLVAPPISGDRIFGVFEHRKDARHVAKLLNADWNRRWRRKR